MRVSDLSHLVPALKMKVFHELGDITLAEKIAQEAIGRGILAIARGEVREGVDANVLIEEIAGELIQQVIGDRR